MFIKNLTRKGAESGQAPSVDLIGEPLSAPPKGDRGQRTLSYAVDALAAHFASRERSYVSGQQPLYYDPQDPQAAVVMDLLVAFGIEKRARNGYRLWEEGKGPDFVLEIPSPQQQWESLGPKRGLYCHLKVLEYWLFAPEGDLDPPLQGYRLHGNHYERLSAGVGLGGALSLHSPVLALDLRLVDGELRFFEPKTNRKLATLAEAEEERRAAEEALICAERGRRLAEAALVEAERALERAEEQRQLAQTARAAADARGVQLQRQLAALKRQLTPAPLATNVDNETRMGHKMQGFSEETQVLTPEQVARLGAKCRSAAPDAFSLGDDHETRISSPGYLAELEARLRQEQKKRSR